ncbi:MAG: hypothetical protein AB1400_08770 [Pseudomonadota bacterium]
MSQFPLQLKQYFFTQIECNANPEYRPEGTVNIDSKFVAAPSEDGPGVFTAELSMWVNEETSENPPYFIKISGFCVLQAAPDVSPEMANQLAVTSGAQVLVGAIREEIARLTARGPWGTFMLPLIPVSPPVPQQP